jgi:6-phosphofructokinase
MKYYHYCKEDTYPNHPHNKCERGITIIVNCGGNGNNEETAAFRAVNNQDQRIDAVGGFDKVLFQNEQFDIGNIYNANNSTFVPRKDGVYYVAGTVSFLPDSTTEGYRVRVEIRVNGVSVAADNDYWGEIDQPFLFVNAINVSTILKLEAGDLVEVFITSTTPGVILTNVPDFSTRFEAKL